MSGSKHPRSNWKSGSSREKYGPDWEKQREVVLKRDNYLCQCKRCKKSGIMRPATEVDHILPVEHGGSDDYDNLQAINSVCHKLKTAEDEGKRMYLGCDENGIPLDPFHPWNRN